MNHIKDTLKKYIFSEGVVGCFAALCADIAIVKNINVSECVIKWVYIANAVISILFNIVLNFCYPRSNKHSLNVYLMFVAPEGQDIEKFIQKEIKELEQVNAGYKINFVLPCKIQRLSFDRLLKYTINHCKRKNKNVAKSLFIRAFGNWTNANVILTGTIVNRTEGNGKYVCDMSGYYLLSEKFKALSQHLKESINGVFDSKFIISKDQEISGFEELKRYLIDLVKFMVGCAWTASGNIEEAYKIHSELYYNKSSKVFACTVKKRNILADTLLTDIDICYAICIRNRDYEKAKSYIEEEMKIDNTRGIVNYAQYLLITSLSEQEMKRNVRMLLNKKAFKGVNKDLTYYADMAYMLLLMDNYKEADRIYKKVFNTQNNQIEVNNLCKGLLDYCDIACTKAYERCYASYLKFRICIFNGEIQEAKFIMDNLSSENVVNTNILNRMKEIMKVVCPLDVALS